MEIGQGPNLGSSAKEKKNWAYNIMMYASVVDAADELLHSGPNSCTSVPNTGNFQRFHHSIPFRAEGCVALQGENLSIYCNPIF
jgi:hypothetical protein